MVSDFMRSRSINDAWNFREQAYHTMRRNPDALFALEKPEHIFQPTDTVYCIDGRIAGAICSAGGCLLLDEESDVRAFFDNAGITVVTSHEGCGAGKLAFFSEFSDRSQDEVVPQEIEDWVQMKTRQLAERHGRTYGGHLAVSTMPISDHEELATYYVAAPIGLRLEPNRPDVLDGFVISAAAHQRAKTALHEAMLSIAIAFGDHGMGRDFFTEERPHLLIGLGDPHSEHSQGETLRGTLRQAIANAIEHKLLRPGDEQRIEVVVTNVPHYIVNQYSYRALAHA